MPNLLHISVRLSGPYYLKSLGKRTENCVLLELQIYADYSEYVMQIVQAQGPCCNSKGRIIYHNHIRQLQQASCICWHKYLLFSGIFCSYIDQKCQISFRIFIQAHKFCATTSIVDSSLHPIQVPTYVLHTYIVSPSGFFQEAV